MRIEALAHILRAAKAITGQTVFVLAGSQAVLVQFPDAPEALLMSMEIDLYPRDTPDLAEVIEGALGANSPFHGTFGYHAVGIGPETAVLPPHWQSRAAWLAGHPLLEGSSAMAPEIHDLAMSKLAAFRDKDRDWVRAAIHHGLIDPDRLLARLGEIEESRLPIKPSLTAWVAAETRRATP